MNELAKLVVLAMMGESIWESLKMLWQKGKLHIDRVGALAVGLLLAVGTGIDLFELVKIPLIVPYLGMVLTGILISRGANFIHDLLKRIEAPSLEKVKK
jgi:hypothetical protein